MQAIRETTCAFCKGTGKDPFKLLSRMSACQVCGSTGKVKIHGPPAECVFCQGRGVYPHSRITCSACGGKGSVPFAGAREKCPECGGLGRKADGDHLPCSVCNGKGIVRKRGERK